MMGAFRVIWRRWLIEVELAGFVVKAIESGDDSGDITRAMAEIDRLLAGDPKVCGESRPNFERVLCALPLVVHYEVHEDERIVHVQRVRYAPKRRR